ncbi:MAG: YfiR family protein [Hyphomonadaceae bacterium]
MRKASAIATFLMAALLVIVPSARAQTSDELVKATFLYRFTSFVTWPADAFAGPETPVSICVIGANPFSRVLQSVVANQQMQGRAFEVRRLSSVSAADGCHVVYVAGDRADDALRAMRGRPVLTVTDGTIGGNERGVIHFVIVRDHVRFHIDEARAAEGGLVMSSRLLSLAVSVRRRPTA